MSLPVVIGAVAALLAAVDWVAKARDATEVRQTTKPAVIVALLGVALTLEPVVAQQRAWVIAALAAGVLGDLALLRPGAKAMVAGAATFAVGHLCYIAGFVVRDADGTLPGALLVVAAAAGVALPAVLRAAAQRSLELATGVVVYVGTLSALLIGAMLSGGTVATAGAMAFVLSDVVLLRDRFVGDVRWLGLAATVGYHVAQALLVASLAVGG